MLIFQETVCVMYLYVIMIYLYKYIITLLSPSHLPCIGTQPSVSVDQDKAETFSVKCKCRSNTQVTALSPELSRVERGPGPHPESMTPDTKDFYSCLLCVSSAIKISLLTDNCPVTS